MPLSTLADDLVAGLSGLLGDFIAERRLYALEGDGDLGQLLVESWSMREGLNAPWELQLNALSLRVDLDVHAMLGQQLTLITTLADGSKLRRGGLVTDASVGDADGGLTRYHLTLRPWLALLGYTSRSRLWQDSSLVQIIESVFASYSQQAAWRWAPDTAAHLAASAFANAQGLRSTTTQYRETDLAFVQRLLIEEGLVYRFEIDENAPFGHSLVILADTPSASSCPADPTSDAGMAGSTGIRFHRASSIETQDAIQAFGGRRSLQASTTTVLAWDYKAKKAIAASVPTAAEFGGPGAPRLESYDPSSPYTYPSSNQAERAGVLAQQALEARHKSWLGRSTVRTFASGSTFELTQSTLDALMGAGDKPQNNQFLLLSVTHAGMNNLPKDIGHALATTKRAAGVDLLAPWVGAELKKQVLDTGYANGFEAIRTHVPWRPMALDETGARLNPKPTALGMQTAIVVGATGETQASGVDEITPMHSAASRSSFTSSAWPAAPTPARPAPGCACCNATPVPAWACSSSRASARRCWSISSKATSTGRSWWVRFTTARARPAPRRPRRPGRQRRPRRLRQQRRSRAGRTRATSPAATAPPGTARARRTRARTASATPPRSAASRPRSSAAAASTSSSSTTAINSCAFNSRPPSTPRSSTSAT